MVERLSDISSKIGKKCQSILLIQGPIPEIFEINFGELGEVKISVFLSRQFCFCFNNKKKSSSPLKLVNIYNVARMGRNLKITLVYSKRVNVCNNLLHSVNLWTNIYFMSTELTPDTKVRSR